MKLREAPAAPSPLALLPPAPPGRYDQFRATASATVPVWVLFTLATVVSARGQSLEEAADSDVTTLLPWWFSLTVILVAVANHLAGARLRRGWARFQITWLLLAWLLPAWPIAWLAAPIQAVWSWPTPGGRWRVAGFASLGAAALLSGALVFVISDTFISTWPGDGSSSAIGWYALTLIGPMIVGGWFLRWPPGPRLARGALLALGLAVALTPPGVHYTAWARALSTLTFPLTLVVLFSLVRPRGRQAAWLLLVTPGLAFCFVTTGGSDWQYDLHGWLRLPASMLYALLAIPSAALMALAPKERRLPLMATLVLSVGALLALAFGFAVPLERAVSLAWLASATVAGLVLLEPTRDHPRHGALSRSAQAVLLACGVLLAVWVGSDGLFSERFPVGALPEHSAFEATPHRWLEVGDAALLSVTYLLTVCPVLLAAAALLGAARFGEVVRGAILVLAVKLLCQCLQFVGVGFVQTHDAPQTSVVTEAVAVFDTLLSVVLIALPLAFFRHLHQWFLGRHRVPV